MRPLAFLIAATLVASGPGARGDTHGNDHKHEHEHGHEKVGHGNSHQGEGDGHVHDHGDHATATHRFEDAEAWAQRFEDPARDEWQHPERVVAALLTRDDLVIADIGSATGYFPVRFARAVPNGHVIGSDIEPEMVTYLNDRARSEGLDNLVSVLAGPDDPHLPRTVDLIFFCDTVHHIGGRVEYFERLKSSLRPGGRVAIVDFRLDSERGPPHKLDPAQLTAELVRAGYELAADHDFLPDQYFLVFTPSD